MPKKTPIILIDGNSAQRAEVASMLASSGFEVRDPDDCPVPDGTALPPAAALIADGPEAVAATFRSTRMSGLRIPLMAYGRNATSHEIVRLHSAGAADYIEWPFDAAILTAALQAAANGADAWPLRSSGTGAYRRCIAG